MTNYAPIYVQLVTLCVNLAVQVIYHFEIRYRIHCSIVVFNKLFSVVKDVVVIVPGNGHHVMAALPFRDLSNAPLVAPPPPR